jgi:hypothetical protein
MAVIYEPGGYSLCPGDLTPQTRRFRPNPIPIFTDDRERFERHTTLEPIGPPESRCEWVKFSDTCAYHSKYDPEFPEWLTGFLNLSMMCLPGFVPRFPFVRTMESHRP